jgi:hypothetical protein
MICAQFAVDISAPDRKSRARAGSRRARAASSRAEVVSPRERAVVTMRSRGVAARSRRDAACSRRDAARRSAPYDDLHGYSDLSRLRRIGVRVSWRPCAIFSDHAADRPSRPSPGEHFPQFAFAVKRR